MKDKLVKSGHRRHYYAFRRAAKATFAIAALALAASIPVMIAYGVSVAETRAEAAKAEEQEESTPILEYTSEN